MNRGCLSPRPVPSDHWTSCRCRITLPAVPGTGLAPAWPRAWPRAWHRARRRASPGLGSRFLGIFEASDLALCPASASGSSAIQRETRMTRQVRLVLVLAFVVAAVSYRSVRASSFLPVSTPPGLPTRSSAAGISPSRAPTGPYPSWLLIHMRKDTQLQANFVGRFGSVRSRDAHRLRQRPAHRRHPGAVRGAEDAT